jgi:competence protein ComEC
VVSERRLPRTCRPKWLKLDRPVLERTGGLTINLKTGQVTTVRRPGDRHPWRVRDAR